MMLIDEMRDALPLYAYPTKQLIETLPDIHLSKKTRLEIDNVFFAGNEGGIMCAVKFQDQTVGVISATNLVFSDQRPIYAKINDYRRDRSIHSNLNTMLSHHTRLEEICHALVGAEKNTKDAAVKNSGGKILSSSCAIL